MHFLVAEKAQNKERGDGLFLVARPLCGIFYILPFNRRAVETEALSLLAGAGMFQCCAP